MKRWILWVKNHQHNCCQGRASSVGSSNSLPLTPHRKTIFSIMIWKECLGSNWGYGYVALLRKITYRKLQWEMSETELWAQQKLWGVVGASRGQTAGPLQGRACFFISSVDLFWGFLIIPLCKHRHSSVFPSQGGKIFPFCFAWGCREGFPSPLPGLELSARAWQNEVECPVPRCMVSNPNYRAWVKRRKEEEILGTLAFDFRDVGGTERQKKATPPEGNQWKVHVIMWKSGWPCSGSCFSGLILKIFL